MSDGPKVFILGLDGGDWKLLDHMIDSGVMPNLKRLKENGAWGDLESTIPPITCPAWLTYGTGKNPGRFGVYFFMEKMKGSYKQVPFYFKRELRGDNFWDILSEEGFKVGVVNIPTVHKPYPINGFMICGFMSNFEENWIKGDFISTKEEGISYPEDLVSGINSKVGKYYVQPPKAASNEHGKYSNEEKIDDLKMVMTRRKDALLHLMKEREWDLITVDFTSTDRLGHLMYKLICPDGLKYNTSESRRLRKKVNEFYSSVDEVIGDLEKEAGEDAHFMIMSDHGFGNLEGQFAINDWLIRKGYMKMKGGDKENPKRRFAKLISRINHRLGISPILAWITGKLPSKYKKNLPSTLKRLKDEDIDWGATKVFYQPFGKLFINLKGREKSGIVTEEEAGPLLDELIEGLRAAGIEHFKDDRFRFFRREETYWGKYLDEASELYFDIDGVYYGLDTRIGHSSIFERSDYSTEGDHRQNGIFIAKHDDIKPGKYDALKLIDIAPTVLRLFGVATPPEVDGKPMLNIFKKGGEIHNIDLRRTDSSEKRKIRSTLKGLKLKI